MINVGRVGYARAVERIGHIGRHSRISNLIRHPEIQLRGPIGPSGVTAAAVRDQLSRSFGAPVIKVIIDSEGGDVAEGFEIFDALREHPAEIHVFVDGVAASIASVIAMAGDRIVMCRGSAIMMHEPHGRCADASASRLSVALEADARDIAATYARRAGGTIADWRALMRREIWYSASDAVRAGLADSVRDW